MSSSPRHLLHYRVLDKLGEGGMGEVYRAEDTRLGRVVALKLLPPAHGRDAKARLRLVREARAASALNHPHIVVIHAIEEHEGVGFLVMEYVEGEPLSARIRGGPLAPAALFELGAQIAEALSVAHEAGLVHRDIKPSNVLVTPRGAAKVLDFGIAKWSAVGAQGDVAPTLPVDLTGSGVVLGTAPYMSPEQARGAELAPSSDVFSLGVLLFEAATGRLPFYADSMLAILHLIATADPPSLRALRSELPPELERLVLRMLEKNPARRPSATAVAAELRSLLERSRERPPLTVGMATATGLLVPSVAVPSRTDGGLVGRGAELGRVLGLLAQAAAGAGGMVFLSGGPGIGKSALVHRLKREGGFTHGELRILTGQCVEQYGSGEAYLPFLDALGRLTGPDSGQELLRLHAPTWLVQMPSAAMSSGAFEHARRESLGATRERMMRELGDVLEAMARTRPLLLVLEDLQWADRSSVDLLRHLAPRLAATRALVVGTHRPADTEASNAPLRSMLRELVSRKLGQELALAPLAREHVQELLDARFAPNDFPDELVSMLHERTEGLPLFLSALADQLAEAGHVAWAASRFTLVRPVSAEELGVPDSVRGMIDSRLEVLTDADQRLLSFASVVGVEFDSATLAALVGEEQADVEERLKRLERARGLVRSGGELVLPAGVVSTRYRFAHALYHDALYSDLVASRRVQLHRRAGELLLGHHGDQAFRLASQLAVHFERGRDLARAVEHLLLAADLASMRFDPLQAIDHCTRAVELAGSLPEEERAQRLALAYHKRAAAHEQASRWNAALADLEQARRVARAAGLHEIEAVVLASMVRVLYFAHRTPEMVERGREAIALAEERGQPALRVEAQTSMILKHVHQGELEDASNLAAEVIAEARRLGAVRALCACTTFAGLSAFFRTDYATAERMLTEAYGLVEMARDGAVFLVARFVLGLTLANLGRMSEALRVLHHALEVSRRNAERFAAGRIPNCIGWVHRELGDREGALEWDRRGLQVAREIELLEGEANSLLNLGLAEAAEGRLERADATYREVENIFARDDWMRWRYNLRLQAAWSRRWLASGDLERAEQHAASLLTSAGRHGVGKYLATGHLLRGEIALARGAPADAADALDEALAQLEATPAPLVTWRVRGARGEALRRLGRASEAERERVAACAVVDGIAASVDDARLRGIFLASPEVRALRG